MKNSRFPGFHRLTPKRRLALLEERGWLSPGDRKALEETVSDLGRLDGVSENVVAGLPLPVGLVTNMVVNGIPRIVPMAIEEPSVVAACSKSALLFSEHGGVIAVAGDRTLVSHVLYRTDVDAEEAGRIALEHKQAFIAASNARHEGVVEAGGGVLDVQWYTMPGEMPGHGGFLLTCAVGDCMGANYVNEVAEHFKRFIGPLVPGEPLAAIVSNLPTGEGALAEVALPVEALAWEGMSGAEVADRLHTLSIWALADPFRTYTHNKGILNGICGVLQALYQDTRAQSAAFLSPTLVDEDFMDLPGTLWVREGDVVKGRLEAPIVCGTVGGTGPVFPTTEVFHRLMGVRSAADLEEVLAAVGLLQNFGAMLAIATEGIQEGHMRLHGRKDKA